jgi:murein DD-endopeptidase MepM/ murein hydrolase activator NlpD
MKGHTGLDLYAPRRTKLYASQSGTVVEISTEPERGLGVDVVTDGRWQMDQHDEHYAKYRNWHMLSLAVQKGQHVNTGDLLGEADTTGLSAGDHNHFELKPSSWARMVFGSTSTKTTDISGTSTHYPTSTTTTPRTRKNYSATT